MKTISIEDDVYKKLLTFKTELNTKSFSETLRKILSEDRVSWALKLNGNMKIDEKKLKILTEAWNRW